LGSGGGGVTGVGRSGGIISHDRVIVGSVAIQIGILIRRLVCPDAGNLRTVAIDPEPCLVAGIVGPGEVDLAGRDGGRGEV